MKGVILAGGYGTRLGDLTRVTNKHLLPIYDRPMIYYPIQTLIEAGVRDIMIVTGGNWAGDFLQLLGNGKKEFGEDVNIHYTYQDGAGGIPAALHYAKDFAEDGPVCVILGDNVFEPGVATEFIKSFKEGGRIFLKEVPDPNRFGVAVIRGGKLLSMCEKPEEFISSYAITGLYCFDRNVWPILDRLEPSARGELEVVDIHKFYHRTGKLDYDVCHGWWTDAGTFESLFRAGAFVRAALET